MNTPTQDIISTDMKCFRSCPNKATERLWIYDQDFHFCKRCYDIVSDQVEAIASNPPNVNSNN